MASETAEKVCGTCGGSGEVAATDVIQPVGVGFGTRPCPDCRSPEGDVDMECILCGQWFDSEDDVQSRYHEYACELFEEELRVEIARRLRERRALRPRLEAAERERERLEEECKNERAYGESYRRDHDTLRAKAFHYNEKLKAVEARYAALRDAVLEFLHCLKYHEEGIGIYRDHFDPDVKSPYLDDSHTAAALDELRRAARTGEE